MPSLSSLHDRAADLSEPLLVLGDIAGGPWPKLAREAVVGLAASAEQMDPAALLLLEIIKLLKASGGRMFTRTLVAGLKGLPDRAWAGARKDHEITDRWLARELAPYDIRPKTIWIGQHQGKGYCEQDVAEALRRYFPAADVYGLGEPRPKNEPGEAQGGEAEAA